MNAKEDASGDTTLPLAEWSDEQLAAEAARERSDGPAFVMLLDRHRDTVWRTCYRLLGNREDANDAAQEVFVRLFLNRAKFAGRSRYSTWVGGIALRTCLTLRRSRGRRTRHETAAAEQTPPTTPAQNETQQSGIRIDLDKMLEALPEEDRAILILKHAEGHSYEELAEMFELSVSACKMRVARARQKLQELFPEHSEDET